MKEVRYYRSFSDDFSLSPNQDYKVPEGYRWIRRDFLSRFLSALTYSAAILFSNVYCRIFLGVRFKNRKALKNTKESGAFIYANHTQPIGDVFNPALAALPNRIYTVVSPANLGLPVIGKILPFLGALPIEDSIKGMKSLSEAIECRIKEKKCVVIYPEAHVWEYYTGIRPFPSTSFRYPVKLGAPVFAMTTTYKKRRFFKRPLAVIYIDGPFYSKGSKREEADKLKDTVYGIMLQRSRKSDCEYIEYKKEL